MPFVTARKIPILDVYESNGSFVSVSSDFNPALFQWIQVV
jgi:hypothetical protein